MSVDEFNEVLAQKISSLQRCVARAREARRHAGSDFATEFDLQDAAVLNVIRACETAIDLANMLIRRDRLGIPAESREAFDLLVREQRIDPELGKQMKKMVGFRNIAVHQYRDLSADIVAAVIDSNLDDLLEFAARVHRAFDS
ncbi:MAG: DUF86 domain-containing protein [Wenzhouxiangellaceae bacterium]|nr:DUF86 domain-containing protein [Wenzhouxiangellaceae bacterium]